MKKDVAAFELHLEDNIFSLHRALISQIYTHDPYDAFYICDPKRRHIHKASVRDRVLHQAIFRVLYPLFDKHFIDDSYSSRVGKGTHKGVQRLVDACRKVSMNWKKTTYALKCDVRKFFDSIDHTLLRTLIAQRVCDVETMELIDEIFRSFEKEKGKGLPLGNVTSQLFCNIYLDELDQFAKHTVKAKHYFRYCDDFVIVHDDEDFLKKAVLQIEIFLRDRLLLELHPNKVEIRKITQGVDFLGYVILPHAQVLRTKTRRRLLRNVEGARRKFEKGEISSETFQSIISSYLGVLSRSKSLRLTKTLKKYYK